MLAWVLLIFTIIVFTIAAITSFIGALTREAEIIVFPWLVALLLAFVPVMVLVPSVHSHAHDIGTVRNAEAYIEVQLQAIKDIDEQLNSLGAQTPTNTALLNADTPIASLVKAKTQFVRDIAKTRLKVVEAKTDIDRRSIGLMSGVVDWYGRE